jgi:redox-sensitive bicupin YhaK (pirin superfamily)
VTVLLGDMKGEDGVEAASPIRSLQDMTYLVLRLDAGRTWRHTPPQAHDVAWTFGFEGEPLINGTDGGDAMLVLSADGDIEITAAKGDVRVLIGTARHHPYPLVLGPSSVHTNLASLERAAARIRQIGDQLAAADRSVKD